MALAINCHRLLLVVDTGQRLLTTTSPTTPELWQTLHTTNRDDAITTIQSKRYFWAAVTAQGNLLVCGQPHKFMDYLFRRTIPVQGIPRSVFDHENIIKLACGAFHVLVLTNKGRVFAWGANYKGQLGLPVPRSLATPTALPADLFGDDDTEIAGLAAGDVHSLAITKHGTLWGWGHAHHGQLGLGAEVLQIGMVLTPQRLPSLPAIAGAAAGRMHTVAVDHTGQVWGTGQNRLGQLGLGDRTPRACFARIEQPTAFCAQHVASIACADEHTAAVTAAGDVWTWGWSRAGCLGYPTTQASLVPQPVGEEHFGQHTRLASVYCADDCTAVVSDRGEVFVWGAKRRYLLGHRWRQELGRRAGPEVRINVPVRVKMQGAVGRGARLPQAHEVAFAMLTHARLGRQSAMHALHAELVEIILRLCVDQAC